ncbi:MAG: DUF4861 family protein [Candidatus Latescibacterota bacterium]
MNLKKMFLCGILAAFATAGYAQNEGWYTEGDFAPTSRVKITLVNTLNIPRKDIPVAIPASLLPITNVSDRYITVVDPTLPGKPEPTKEELAGASGYLERKETNGHFLEYQMDDVNHDGIWDELFFMIDMKPRETKNMYLYIGYSGRGLYPHKTHAGIGYYGRHMVPFWEAEYVGWKLWFSTDVDLHGKREPMLTAYPEYTRNLSGYFMPAEYGTDMMTVANTFGSGGVCLFEHPSLPDSLSRPRYSPSADKGPYMDTRYAFDVVYNGPLRSAIRAKTMNWNSGAGQYELEQLYTAYAHKSYSTCKVNYRTFLNSEPGTLFGCGIREIMNQNDSYQKDGLVVSFGKNVVVRPPNNDIGEKGLIVDFEGLALVVKDSYKPEYRNIKSKSFGNNHVFRIPVNPDRSFEYLIAGAWSQGAVNKTPGEFKEYMITVAQEYNNPPVVRDVKLEKK